MILSNRSLGVLKTSFKTVEASRGDRSGRPTKAAQHLRRKDSRLLTLNLWTHLGAVLSSWATWPLMDFSIMLC